MKLKLHTLLTLAVAGGLAGHAGADLVATDLNDGGTDTGFSGGWAGSVNRFIITAPDLTYLNYGITQTGTVQGTGVVPEPSTALLGGLGLLAMLRRRR